MGFDESKHPRDNEGKFTVGYDSRQDEIRRIAAKQNANTAKENSKIKKSTPTEKIASVHIDFDKDNLLPELNESELQKVGAERNKPILLKKKVIDRNRIEHADLTDEDFEQIIKNALYAPSEVFPANKDKPYYHFAKVVEVNSKGKPEIGLALLDIDNKKDNFEIVHAHFVGSKAYERAKKKD